MTEVVKEVAVLRLLGDHPSAVQLHQVRQQSNWIGSGSNDKEVKVMISSKNLCKSSREM